MPRTANGRSVETLIREGLWEDARALIERELAGQPENHWLLTHLGVTYYEQQRYSDSLRPLLASLEIVPDCPLTLWNIAGALGALGKPKEAIRIYTSLLRSDKTADDDSCWESADWANALKADCVYRIGCCFQRMKRRDSAENCFRQYINLMLAGTVGTYTVEDAALRIGELRTKGKRKLGREVKEAIGSTLGDSGLQSISGIGIGTPSLSAAEVLAR